MTTDPPERDPASSTRGRVKLGPADAAIFETFVVPRYLALFGELAIEMLVESEDAQVFHMHCRTGYPDRGVAMRLPGAHFYGCDESPSALELARAKATTMAGMIADYRLFEGYPVPLPATAFSHAITIHPLANVEERARTLTEFGRLLAPHGQALVAMPLRGSFQELADLMREYALKFEADALVKALDTAMLIRPTVEMFGAELEEAGFQYVDVEVRTHTLKFRSGRDFFEDPVVRLLILPEIRFNLGLPVEVDKGDPYDAPMAYIREAIDKYWSDGAFELTVNVGCASGRRLE
jgi:SAM-dependent methyltransferase